MSVDLQNQATAANRGESDLSRRGFLARLAVIAVSGAAAMTMRTNEANAAAESDMPSRTIDLADSEPVAKDKKADLAQNVDPDDPLQHFARRYYRRRRVYLCRRRFLRRAYRRRIYVYRRRRVFPRAYRRPILYYR